MGRVHAVRDEDGAGVEVAGELAESEAVAQGQRHEVVVGFETDGGDRALGFAAEGVGAVEHDDRDVGVGAGFEHVAEDGFKGPEADAGILKVDDDGVEGLEVGLARVLVGGFGAVERDDRGVGVGVFFGGEAVGILGGVEAVLRGEDGLEVHAVGVGEDVDGAVAAGVAACLVDEEADAEGLAFGVGECEELGKVEELEDVDAGEGSAFGRKGVGWDLRRVGPDGV